MNIDKLLRLTLSSREQPDEALNQRLNMLAKERTEWMRRRRPMKRMVLIAAVLAVLITATAFAAWRLMTPAEVAQSAEDQVLRAAFESDTAININKSITSGEYTFTLMAIVTGKDITDMPLYSQDVQDERTYAIAAIRYADGTPMPSTSDEAYGRVNFFVSPLVKGLQPWLYNMASMHGTCTFTVVDGVMYCIAACDGVTMFADRGLYFVICDSTLYDGDAIVYHAETGEITLNPDYEGSCALFDLPIDKALADRAKAEQYMDERFIEADADIVKEDAEIDFYYTVPLEDCELVADSVKILTLGEDGFYKYKYDGGAIGVEFNALPREFEVRDTDVVRYGSCGAADDKHLIVFTKDAEGVVRGMLYKAPQFSDAH